MNSSQFFLHIMVAEAGTDAEAKEETTIVLHVDNVRKINFSRHYCLNSSLNPMLDDL